MRHEAPNLELPGRAAKVQGFEPSSLAFWHLAQTIFTPIRSDTTPTSEPP